MNTFSVTISDNPTYIPADELEDIREPTPNGVTDSQVHVRLLLSMHHCRGRAYNYMSPSCRKVWSMMFSAAMIIYLRTAALLFTQTSLLKESAIIKEESISSQAP